MQAIQHLKVIAPTNEKRTVASPRRKANAEYRQREHLTEREVETLVEVAKDNRWGLRDSTKADIPRLASGPVIANCGAITLGGLIYQFDEAATKLNIENLVDTFSTAHAVIVCQRVKLAF